MSSYSRGCSRLSESTPYYRDTLQGECVNTLPLRDCTTRFYPLAGGMTKQPTPPKVACQNGTCQNGTAKMADTLFLRSILRGTEAVLLENFFVHFFFNLFSEKPQDNLLENFFIFLRCVRAKISLHDMRHIKPASLTACRHHHLVC